MGPKTFILSILFITFVLLTIHSNYQYLYFLFSLFYFSPILFIIILIMYHKKAEAENQPAVENQPAPLSEKITHLGVLALVFGIVLALNFSNIFAYQNANAPLFLKMFLEFIIAALFFGGCIILLKAGRQ